MLNRKLSYIKNQLGFSIMESLVVMGLSVVVLGTMLTQYTESVSISYDLHIKQATQNAADSVLSFIGNEIRMIGNGVPNGQDNFEIDEANLTDGTNPVLSSVLTQPIIASTTAANYLQYRINENGTVYVITSDFTPNSSLNVVLTSVDDLNVNDRIYISNNAVAGEDGFTGTIDSINTSTKTVTLNSSYIMSNPATTTFDAGSLFEQVALIELDSTGSAVTYDAGFSTAEILSPNSSFTLTYLNKAGAALTTLPLTVSNIRNDLGSIRVAVTVNSQKNLKDGTAFSATSTQTYSLRNLK